MQIKLNNKKYKQIILWDQKKKKCENYAAKSFYCVSKEIVLQLKITEKLKYKKKNENKIKSQKRIRIQGRQNNKIFFFLTLIVKTLKEITDAFW